MRSTFPNHFHWIIGAALFATAVAAPTDAWTRRQNHRAENASVLAWRALETWQMTDARRLAARLEVGPERRCAEGVIADRDNQVRASIALLEECLAHAHLRAIPAVTAREALMDGYGKIFDYGAQARTGAELIRLYAGALTKGRRDDIRSDQAMAAALASTGTPPQTVTGNGPVTLPTTTNAMGTVEANLVGNGVPASWMIDTGANYSVVTEGLARRMGVIPLEAHVDVVDSREKSSSLRIGVVRTLEIGSLTFHNVVSFIVPDDIFRVEIGGKIHHISAVLGHPVLSALGRVTFDAKGTMTGDPGAPDMIDGGRMYMRMLTPLLETTTIEHTALFGLDTGANVTSLFSPFARAMPGGMGALRSEERRTVGVSSSGTAAEAILPELHLRIGGDTVTMTDVSIDSEHGKDGPRYGNVGFDLWKGRSSMTIDYRSMRFKLGPPR